MIIDNCYVVTPETATEVKLANEAILAYRQQRLHDELIQEHKKAFSAEISKSIRDLGFGETKRLLRELNRELREVTEM